MKLIAGFVIVISFIVFLVRFYCSLKASNYAYEKLEASQTNESVDAFIRIISKYQIENNPPTWNRVRGIWFRVNESPNVTAERKTELRNLLVSKGLRLTTSERNIIDNYKAASN